MPFCNAILLPHLALDRCSDFHHTGNRGNFGAPHLDHFFGTMDCWLDLGGMDGYLEMKANKAGGEAHEKDQ